MKKRIISLLLSLVMIVQLLPTVSADSGKTFEKYIISCLEQHMETIDVTEYMKANGWTVDETAEAYQQVIYDNPQLFYVSGDVTKSWNTKNGQIVKLALKNLGYAGSASQIASMKKKFDAAVSKALAEVDKNMTDVEKALALHDYLILNCAYDTKLKNYDAYDCLVTKSAVCQGYSLAYKYLLNQVGVECETVSSKSMNHMWNYVKIGTKWYHVDVTMDDPLFNKRDSYAYVSHEYFMVSDKLIAKGSYPHKDWDLNGLPKATSTTYDKSVWRDSESAMVKAGSYWYYLKVDPNSPGLQKNPKSSEIYTYLYRYSFATKKYKKIYTINSTWTKWGDKNSWYTGSYAKLAEYNGKVYFNSRDKIYYYNTKNGKVYTIKTLKGVKGYIYGLTIVDGKLKYNLKTSPEAKDAIKTIALSK